MVEQAKNIALHREQRNLLAEIRLYNSMVLGIQNYYQIATCISIDCRDFQRRVMTILTNRLKTEKGTMLKRDGGTLTEAERERFGKSKMIRYVSGIDQVIYPIGFIKSRFPVSKKAIICSYTVEGRAPIHNTLNLNSKILKDIRSLHSRDQCLELVDSMLSLYSAQKGKCSISGEIFTCAEDICCWLKVSKECGGTERYRNLVLFNSKYSKLLMNLPITDLKKYADTLDLTKKMITKLNALRKQRELSEI